MDECIQEFYETGYIHNHMRMYIAAVCCNMWSISLAETSTVDVL